jgi:predicted RNase H-like HicB family nuclease
MAKETRMQTIKFIHWQDADAWLGYLQDYPDYWTPGESLDELIEHLRDLYLELTSGHISGIRKFGEIGCPMKRVDLIHTI